MNRILSSPSILLRIEGAVVLTLALLFYGHTGSSGWMLALLILAPDLAMLGYLAGAKVGAAIYNLIHAYVLPGALAVFALGTANSLALSLSLIWFAHIGADRLLGYGLKYPTEFKDTHFSRV